MKILAIGDFHGKCPINLKKICKDNKIDLILCTGDYASFHARKDFFKYSYGTKNSLEKFIGKEKVIEYTNKDLKDAETILKKINDVGLPVISVTGNIDRTGCLDIGHQPKPKWDYYTEDHFHPIASKFKNIKFIEFDKTSFKGFNIIGYPRSNYPGFVPIKVLFKKPYRIFAVFERRKDRIKEYKIMKKLFEKAKQPVIFLVHNVPYKTKLDVISGKTADKRAKGDHYGSLLTRQIIKKYQPQICVAGHMHESQGKDKIGKTLIVNTGCAANKQYAIINIKNNKVNVKLFH